MEMSNYQKVKKNIKSKLQDLEPPLQANTIKENIYEMRNLLEDNQMRNRMLSFFGLSADFYIAEEDWERMIRELEMHFDVQMDKGFLIQGYEQQKRNNSWWTDGAKNFKELNFWNRYKEYMGQDFPPEVVRTIDTDTDVAMNNIADPALNEFSRYGMVVGHVQSGKTANYSALICKACDAGYKFIIVIAGGINNLRNQTQVRINEAVIGVQNGKLVGVGRLGGNRNDSIPSTLTTTETDFNKRDADKSKGMINFDNISVPVIMVIKKHTNTLTNVIDWLSANYKNKISKHAMLMIDDESDYASINTRGEDDPTTINRKLRQLMSLFDKCAYVAYTATPYANIFIDYKVDNNQYGRDLFPKDFIVALNAPNNYFGARKIFLENNKKYIIHIEDNEDKIPLRHKKDFNIMGLPDSLKEAIRIFIINIAIRNLRGQNGKHNSMLVHVSRFTAIHIKVSFFIENYVQNLKDEIISYGALQEASSLSDDISQIEESFYKVHIDIGHSWETVLEEICIIIRSIKVREVHQKAKIPLEYTNESGVNVIAVGGASLSRGFTLEGLSVSYFMRTTAMYDTLMQMGRWFGYRIGYEDICKIYMSKQMETNFASIIEATEDLFEDFGRMADAKKTPNDFGLSVSQHPDSALQVTAHNKLKHTKDYYFNMKLDGAEKETTCLKKDEKIRNKNLKVVEDFVLKLINNKIGQHEISRKKNLWKDVDREHIIEFLDNYEVFASNPIYITSKMPIDFIRKYANDIDTKWDVLLASGSYGKHTIGNITFRKEYRTMTDKDTYLEANRRQISSESLEKVLFSIEESAGKNRKDLRAIMKKPLLVLHIIDTDKEDIKNLAAFGISFPGGINSGGKLIRHKINSVYVDQIIQDMKEERDSDD
ncbi:Z1 domain-containing protein [Vallitalea sediminicola]